VIVYQGFEFIAVVLEMAPPLCNRSTKPLMKPYVTVCGKLRASLTDMSDIKLIAEILSIATESFRRRIGRCCLPDKGCYPEKAMDGPTKILVKLNHFDDFLVVLLPNHAFFFN
jgi:hypothetical protein